MKARDEKILLLGLAALAFFIRIIPHLFIIPYVGVEEGGSILYCQQILGGNTENIWSRPHMSFIGVAGLHIITGLPLTTCAFSWNPLMAALSTIVFYFILKNAVNVKDPLIGSLLFVTLDSSIYRTTLFGSSGEGLGILILFIFIYIYSYVNKSSSFFERVCLFTLALVSFIALLFIHTIVFSVAILFIIADQVFVRRRITMKKMAMFRYETLLITALVIVGFVCVLPLLPYRYTLARAITIYGLHFPRQPLDFVWGRVLPMLFRGLLGTCILFVISVYYLTQKRDIISYMFILVTLFLVPLTFLVSPYRGLIYIGVIGVVSFASLRINRKKFMAIGLASIMMFQVVSYGWNANEYIYDTVTLSEVEMIEWLVEYDPECINTNVMWDDAGEQLLLYRMSRHYGDSSNDEQKDLPEEDQEPRPEQKENEKLQEFIERQQETWQTYMLYRGALANNSLPPDLYLYGSGSYIKYVIYSDRFASRALIRTCLKWNRPTYGRYEIEDIWANSTLWELIYDVEGEKIYERN